MIVQYITEMTELTMNLCYVRTHIHFITYLAHCCFKKCGAYSHQSDTTLKRENDQIKKVARILLKPNILKYEYIAVDVVW